MARRSSTSRFDSTLPLQLGNDAGSSARSPPAVRALRADDRISVDRRRIRALAERFAADWVPSSSAGPAAVVDGRRAAAADPAETAVEASPETVLRLSGAIQEVIDWIAAQICMHRIPGAHVRGRLWPDLDHEAHLAKRSGLTRTEWSRLVHLLSREASLPIVGRLVHGDRFRATHWAPEEASLTAWSTGWNWDIVHLAAQGRLAG